ncbi:MAG TPA: hypothetical protein VN946_05870 [Terriglobales bacterium]|nr:hypothetical protein [Terriglobales bacterium]
MMQRSRFRRSFLSSRLFSCAFVFFFALLLALTASFAAALAQTVQTTGQVQKDPVADQSARVQPAEVAGSWQVSWQGRLGTEPGVLHLQREGTKLTGTFQDLHGSSPLTGTVDGKTISFDVKFNGPRPFTTRFTGTADGDKLAGTSQAVGVEGGGAFLGHPGEIVHPEHPWTAKRAQNQATPSSEAAANHAGSSQAGSTPNPGPNSAAKN